MESSAFLELLERHSLNISPTWKPFVRRVSTLHSSPQIAWDSYSYGFKLAADAVAREAYEKCPQSEVLWPPLFFLNRHWIELELKTLWKDLESRNWIEIKFRRNHGIVHLWDGIKLPLISQTILRADDVFLSNVERSIHLINSVDPNSTYSRYPESGIGRLHVIEFSLEEFIIATDDINTFFFGLSAMLDQYDDFMASAV